MRWPTVDDTPLVLATADVPAVDNNGPLRADDGKGKEFLVEVSRRPVAPRHVPHLNGLLCLDFLVVILLIVVRVHAQVVELELLLYPVLELGTLLQGQAVALGNDGHDVDELAQLLEDDNVDWLETVTGR